MRACVCVCVCVCLCVCVCAVSHSLQAARLSSTTQRTGSGTSASDMSQLPHSCSLHCWIWHGPGIWPDQATLSSSAAQTGSLQAPGLQHGSGCAHEARHSQCVCSCCSPASLWPHLTCPPCCCRDQAAAGGRPGQPASGRAADRVGRGAKRLCAGRPLVALSGPLQRPVRSQAQLAG